MSIFLASNNAVSELAAPITNTATSISLTAGTGALFPTLGAGQQFALTVTSASNPANIEIMYCTARSGDTLTVLRAQEPVAGVQTAYAFALYDSAINLFTAGTFGACQQTSEFLGQYEVPFFQGYGATASAQIVGDTPVTQFSKNMIQSVFWSFQISTATNLANSIKMQIAYTGDAIGNNYCIQFKFQNMTGANLLSPSYTITTDIIPGPIAAGTESYYQTVTAIIPSSALTSEGWVNCILSRLPANVNDTNTGNLQIINVTMGQ
jgi:hypothetical protein